MNALYIFTGMGFLPQRFSAMPPDRLGGKTSAREGNSTVLKICGCNLDPCHAHVLCHCERNSVTMGYPISTGTKCLPSQQLYKKSRSKTPQRLLHTGTDPEKLGHGGTAARGGVSMPSAFQFQCHLVLIFLAASKGETRYLEVSNRASD